jgi:hypothetical protein
MFRLICSHYQANYKTKTKYSRLHSSPFVSLVMAVHYPKRVVDVYDELSCCRLNIRYFWRSETSTNSDKRFLRESNTIG